MVNRWGTNPLGPYQKVILPWHKPETPQQHEENIRALERIQWGVGEGTRWATVVMAASDSSDLSKSTADYVCTGSHDDITIELAITNMLASNPHGGRIMLLEGTFVCSTPINISVGAAQELVIEGMGAGQAHWTNQSAATIINASGIGSNNVFTVGSGAFALNNLMVRGTTGGAGVFAFNSKISVTNCQFYGRDGVRIFTSAGGSADGSIIMGNHFETVGGGGVDINSADSVIVANNSMSCTAAPCCIGWQYSLGTSSKIIVIGNDISGDSTTDGIRAGNNGTVESLVVGNAVRGCATGIAVIGIAMVVSDNQIRNCTKAIRVTGQFNSITGNNASHSGTPVVVYEIVGGADNNFFALNKCSPSSGSSITNAGINNSIVYNEATTGGPASFTDTGTGTKREADWLLTGQTANINARVAVRQNDTGATVSTRRRLDLIDGTNITWTVVDDSTDEEADITASLRRQMYARKNSTGSTFNRGRFNFIEGSGITLSVLDDSGDDEVDITITSTGAGALIDIYRNGVLIGTRGRVNFIEGTNTSITATDTGTEVDLTFSSTGGGGGGSGSPVFNYLAFR